MTYLLRMTANEFLWTAFLQIMLVFAAVLLLTAVIEAIIRKRELKKERERRAYKRYNASIRPTRRY